MTRRTVASVEGRETSVCSLQKERRKQRVFYAVFRLTKREFRKL